MSDPTPATGTPHSAPDPTPATGKPQVAPDQAATLPMNLNTGHGAKDPLADATVAANLNVKHPEPANEAATLPTARPKDAQDLQATVPAKGWDDASTRLASAPAPGSQPSTDKTLPANLNLKAATPPRGSPLADSSTGANTAATLPMNRAATLPTANPGEAATLATAGASPAGTGSFVRTSFTGRIARTKLNASLPPESQQLDTKLQLSRPSVLADMATARGKGTLPKGVQKLIDEQGTEGRYAINRELAHGGMGAVLDISDHDFRRRAAMKVILARFAESPEAMERFLAEAQVTAQLEHPNIVPIHDLGVMEDGTLYFTMKMIEGQSLGKVVKLLQQAKGLLKAKDGSLVPPDDESRAAAAKWTETEKLHIFLKVLDGVGFANSRGVIHRDLKPDNIMLGGHGEVLVVDWGIAKVLGTTEKTAPEKKAEVGKEVISIRGDDALSATMAGSAMGTIYYMPPEQAQGDLLRIDARSDVYALGATLYELLALKRCLTGTSIQDMIVKISHGEFIPLGQADPTIHPDLVAIVHKAMALSPDKRYADCAAFSADLRRYLAGQAVEARKRSIGELIRQWIAQNKLKLQLGAAAAVLSAVVSIGTVWAVKKHQREEGLAQYQQAKSAFAALPADASVEQFTPILSLVDLAADKLPQDHDVDQLKKDVSAAYGEAKQRAAEIAKKKADAERAAQLIAKAREAAAKGDADSLSAAKTDYEQALDLTPDDKSVQQALLSVTMKLKDTRRLATENELKKHLDNCRAALAEADQMPKLDAKVAELMKTAASELVLADADHDVKIEGVAAVAQQAEAQRSAIARAAAEAKDLERARDLVAQVKTRLENNDPDKALELAQQAMGFAPKDEQVGAAYSAASAAKAALDAKRAEDTRHRNAEDAATKLLADARAAQTEMTKQRDLMLKSRREAQRLERELADKSLSDKKALFAAHQAENEARRALVQSWAACEGLSQNVVATLEPWAKSDPPPAAYRDALSILSQLYYNRLLEAKAARSLPDIEAYRNLLSRADRIAHAYDGELANQATVTISGQPGGAVVMARPVQEGPDARLVATGDPRQIDFAKAVQLPAGTWAFAAGDTTITWVLRPDHPTTIAWPKDLKQIPGLPLRYVPADLHLDADGNPAGMKPFLLGVTEVTVEQYLAFLKDADVFAQVKKEFKRVLAEEAAGITDHQQLPPFVPFNGAGTPVLYKVTFNKDNSEITDLQPAAGVPLDTPVTSITRNDALGYCAWLAKKQGVKARLPRRGEWQFAAGGDDVQRIYPWGSRFDGEFCVSAAVAKPPVEAVPARANTLDVGPFGHFGLAGNVREWLGDEPGAGDVHAPGHRAVIAGGGFADDDEHWFRTTYVETVEPAVRNPVIGFRVLVEVQ